MEKLKYLHLLMCFKNKFPQAPLFVEFLFNNVSNFGMVFPSKLVKLDLDLDLDPESH